MTEKVFFNKREWLNPKGHWDTGAIDSRITADQYGIECSLSFWDCGRKVILDFSADNEKKAKQRAVKIQQMIDHLLGVQQALGKAYNYHLIQKDKNGGGDDE